MLKFGFKSVYAVFLPKILRKIMKKILCTLLFAFVILGTPYQALAQAFITEWITTTGNITIPTTGGGYNYNVSYRQILPTIGGTTTLTGQTGNCTITGLTNGNTYEVSITGTFPRIFFSGSAAERPKIRNIKQWGNIAWSSMSSAFTGCVNLNSNATDAPNLSGVTDMTAMFQGCTIFNGDIGSWSTSTITTMNNTFRAAVAFNQNIGTWNTGNVTNMSAMFLGATAFDQNIGTWNTGNVTDMSFMFNNATAFNQNIGTGTWNTANVANMRDMF
ncbi:MAG: BspA family leucine-rich repeat surface protein, partial [Cytophagales bacterium]